MAGLIIFSKMAKHTMLELIGNFSLSHSEIPNTAKMKADSSNPKGMLLIFGILKSNGNPIINLSPSFGGLSCAGGRGRERRARTVEVTFNARPGRRLLLVTAI